MAELRILTRSQELLRGFFGLGPSQFEALNVIVPSIAIDPLLRGREQVQVIEAISAAAIPGAATSENVSFPTVGPWLVHAIALTTTGPATSGSVRLSAVARHLAVNWGRAFDRAVFDKVDSLLRMGGFVYGVGIVFDTPQIFYGDPAGGSDLVLGVLLNDPVSVGNATLTVSVMARQVENV